MKTTRNKKIKHFDSKNEPLLNNEKRFNVDKILPAIVFFWPFAYLYNLVIPINGQYTVVGNDFIVLYYKYKLFLLACLSEFKFPLWSPSEGAGFPFYSNPFAQAFYPLNIPLAIWYKISGGYNPIDHQVYTVLGISIFALGLFKWLKLINKNTRAVFFSAIIISISFKMTEIIRFPNAVHTAAWYPWVLYAITKIFKSSSLKDFIFSGILLLVFVICLCTGGYPYYVYYSLFLFIPYFLIFAIKPLCNSFFYKSVVKWKNVTVAFIVVAILSALICGPYMLSIKNLMAQTTDRSGNNFNYSTQYIFSISDTLGSWVYPPAAQLEGIYFFSIISFLIILLFIFSKKSTALNTEACVEKKQNGLVVKLVFLVWVAIITYITYGKNSYLFVFLWKYMPGFSSLRVWGRLNIILLPILAWLLSISFDYLEKSIMINEDSNNKRYLRMQPVLRLIIIYSAVLATQLYMVLNKIQDRYWELYFQNYLKYNTKFIYTGMIAFLFLLIIIVERKSLYNSARKRALITVIMIAIAIFEMAPVGNHIWTTGKKPLNNRIAIDVEKMMSDSFNQQRTDHQESISISQIFSVGILRNWYFDRYVKFLDENVKNAKKLKILMGVIGGKRVFFSDTIYHDTIGSFLKDCSKYKNHGQLLSYSGDELNWQIFAPKEGYLSFIDNWDKNWNVSVDGKEKEMEILFNTFKSVHITEGLHEVKFSYKPTFFKSKGGK